MTYLLNYTNFLNESNSSDFVTKRELDELERRLDLLFKKIGLDIEFTKHFWERLNHERNKPNITTDEIATLFNKVFKTYGTDLAQDYFNIPALFQDTETDINIPFKLEFDYKEGDVNLVSKTIMRTKTFFSQDKRLPL